MNYFAYGSNLDHKQMSRRCPKSRFIKRVYLPNYKIIFDGYEPKREGAVGNVLGTANSVVWGGLFEISESDLKSLDKAEDYPWDYQRELLEVFDDNNISYSAYVYKRVGRPLGKPSKQYIEVILKGMNDCNLPQEYITNFQHLYLITCLLA